MKAAKPDNMKKFQITVSTPKKFEAMRSSSSRKNYLDTL
jgi:hypothetical protein